ncbi:photosystem reaction center subunit H [Actinoplanes sp. SE50]|uniref:DUF2382 domain-containing protein n=1 Tax=unclassified Actinoplanes TaxID=2626549 RepID=UPI00023ECE9A|nr:MULTISPECIES: PRC and DUF2382 domain-containing protein [unclassified Actinoplanes]AEV84354.1 uncharacterized protein ACPL_3459 [Actinoplanes sp. SE50/110]ATO82746.1 photosystem reaction center subunit H [Actinoplanes sp. SE50]SLM00153.1 photosystem reaction center subunit H [Actinoplanes sp. SE50/110]
MITQNDIARLDDTDVYDTTGDKIGSVGQVYLDGRSGDPEWVTVKTGLFGTKQTFVPLRDATFADDRVVVAYTKAQVKDAPRIDADGPISHAEENELYSFYGLPSTGGYGDGYQNDDTYQSGARRRATTDHAGDDAMTRSEERLVTDTRTEQAGKARLRKYVVTEQQQVTVPVTHEEARLEREPITDANIGDAYDGPAITEAEHEVTLHAERPVTNTETVPVERVRLSKETVRDEETVSGEVRKEQIEYDGPDGTNRL